MAIKKAAIFLMLIGIEKGQGIMELMDNGEIKAIVSEIRNLTTIPPQLQASVWSEFKELGYEDNMKPAEALAVIRYLFKGGRII